MSAETISELNDAYDGAIAYLDYHIGLLLNALRQQEFLDETLVIIVSDHGEQFGEHGLMSHSNSLYLPNLHVPMLISFPSRIPAGVVVDSPVSLRDIAVTVTDVLNLSHSPFPGQTLTKYWDTSSGDVGLQPEPIFSIVQKNELAGPNSLARRGNIYSLIFEGIHYLKYDEDGREQLFDIETDSEELNDIVNLRHGQALLDWFRKQLDSSLSTTS